MNVKEISARLAQQADTVATYLLPNGKREGNCWRSGSTDGEKGRSLKVVLDGDKAGRWMDHANPAEHGDLVDLWMQSRGMDLVTALRDIKGWLGIVEPSIKAAVRPKIKHPDPKPGTKAATGTAVEKYLCDERGIAPDVLKAYRVAELNGAMVFPYLDPDGARMMIKYIGLDRSNGKKVWTSKDSTKVLYGWHAIGTVARTVVITEGEIDAMTLAGAGVSALSVPYGAGRKQAEWIENDYDKLERFDDIVIWMDRDEAGEEAAEEILERLGVERCRIATTPEPYNDINEMWLATRDKQALLDCIHNAQERAPGSLAKASDYLDEVYEVFHPKDGKLPGFTLGWPSFDHVRFRPSELVVISGFNGHGKSQFAGQVLLEGMANGQRACVASLEMPVRMVLARLMRQAGGVEQPTLPYMRTINEWFEDRLWVYDHVGRTSVDDLLDSFAYAKRRYGVTLFLIDSLMMLGIASDDYSGQKDFTQRLMEWKMEHNVTLLLVAHSRKQASEEQRPSKLDVRGAGEITDMADTVLTVWRDKREERNADGLIECSKQRNGEQEGMHYVWFHPESCQFRPSDQVGAYRYVQYSGLKAAPSPEKDGIITSKF